MLIFSLQVASCSEPVPITEGNGKEHQEGKAVTDGEREAFVFHEGAKVYRCMSDQNGYRCPTCLNVFSRLVQHITSSECGKEIDVKRFTSELKKYLKVQNNKKQKAENPTEFRKKHSESQISQGTRN